MVFAAHNRVECIEFHGVNLLRLGWHMGQAVGSSVDPRDHGVMMQIELAGNPADVHPLHVQRERLGPYSGIIAAWRGLRGGARAAPAAPDTLTARAR